MTANKLLAAAYAENLDLKAVIADYIREYFIFKNSKQLIRKDSSRDATYIRSVLTYFKTTAEERHRAEYRKIRQAGGNPIR